MLELRLLNFVPDQAAPLAFVETAISNVAENISLIDFSTERASNAAEYYNTRGFVRVVAPSGNHPHPSSDPPIEVLCSDFVLGNKTVLSQGVSHSPPLFYRYFLGRGPQIRLQSSSGNITFTVNSTEIQFGSKIINWTGKSTRQIVKEINTSGQNLRAQLLNASECSFESDSFTVGTSTTEVFSKSSSTQNIIYNSSHKFVYAPNASTTDLEAARHTIKSNIEILVDGRKTSQVFWDLWVSYYDSTKTGFVCELYVDKAGFQGNTFQVRYDAIDTSGNLYPQTVEVINPESYLVENIHYTSTDTNGVISVSGVESSKFLWGLGLFSKTGSSQTVSVEMDSIVFGSTSIYFSGAQASSNANKTLSDIAAEINEHPVIGSNFSASALYDQSVLLDVNSIVPGNYTIYPSGTALNLNMDVGVLFSPDSRIHPLLPHDNDIFKSWYPRISKGRFAERRPVVNSGYGINYGKYYGGVPLEQTYVYTIPEYETQVYCQTIGKPYRSVAQEEPILISEKVLRTRRWPIESLANLTLRDGITDISSRISDVDLEQGFLFLDAELTSYNDLTIDYYYEEKGYVYERIDLNPADNYNLIGKYVGLYIIPTSITSGIWTNNTRAVYHIISDTVEDIRTTLDALQFNSSINVNPVLVGVYQVVSTTGTEDVNFREIKTPGGGLREDVLPKGDAAFCWDIGRNDGIPFEGNGSVILEVGSSIIAPSDNISIALDPTVSSNPFKPSSGLWKSEDVENIASRWAAMGTAVLVDFDENA